MVSESQERMLCVVEPERVQDVLAVCARWEVNATAIGEVTDTQRLRVFDGDELVGDMPVTALVDECPAYDLEPAEPATPVYPVPERSLTADDPGEILLGLLASANLASRKWAFEQYDSIVGSRTVRRPEQADAAVLLLDNDLRGERPPPAPRSRSRSTATAGAWPPTRTAARSRPCSSARRTSRASAPSRSGSPTASTSATPRSRTSRGSSRAPSPASATPAARSGSRSSAATSRSTTRAPRARSTRRRWSAWSASCRTHAAPAGSASASRAPRSR